MKRFIWQYIFTFVFIVWVLISYTPYDDFTANCIRIVGVFLVFVGIIGRIYATIFIGGMKNEGVDGSKFIDYGAYSICRNPLYLFFFHSLFRTFSYKGSNNFDYNWKLVFLDHISLHHKTRRKIFKLQIWTSLLGIFRKNS